MPKQRFTTEEIIHKLREADVLSGQSKTVAEVCKQLGVTDKTYFRWRKTHGGLRIDQAKRMKSPTNRIIAGTSDVRPHLTRTTGTPDSFWVTRHIVFICRDRHHSNWISANCAGRPYASSVRHHVAP